ncbi:hypothetical protein PG991_001105 [Apiospora marii]|uniref:Uncharacterized protein n=1 Tax=Apiospora marii TaxID=335849 RepID=A0ABR1SVM4_9PEZI
MAQIKTTLDLDLAAASDTEAAVVETVLEYDHELSQRQGQTARAGLWAHFLQNVVGGGMGVSRDTDITVECQIDRLETRHLRGYPPVAGTAEESLLRARLDEPRVRAVASSRVLGRRVPVYIISGLKIARGLRFRREKRHTVGGGVSADAPVGPDGVLASVGGGLGGERRDEQTSSFRSGEEDVIFAYELSIIRLRGRKDKERVEVDILEHAAAFLHEEEDVKGKEEEMDIAVGIAGVTDISESGVEVKVQDILDEKGDKVICVTAS